MLFTLARCILITSRNGSRFMYQPGQAAPGMASAVVTPRRFWTGSVIGASGSHLLAMRQDLRNPSPPLLSGTPVPQDPPRLLFACEPLAHEQRPHVVVAKSRR